MLYFIENFLLTERHPFTDGDYNGMHLIFIGKQTGKFL